MTEPHTALERIEALERAVAAIERRLTADEADAQRVERAVIRQCPYRADCAPITTLREEPT